ncbi:MAG: cytochrome C biogenesis protein, partial [Ignavibacteria bacterium]
DDNLLSRELALFTGAVTLLASAIIILAGTSSPIFGTSVEVRFYNEMNLPIAIIIGLLNGLSLLIKWRSSDEKNLLKQLVKPLIATVILSALIIFLGGVDNLMLGILTFSTTFAFVVNAEIAFKIFKGRKTHLGAYVTHLGLAFFLMGVIATGGFTQQKSIDLIKNQPTEVLGYKLTFLGYQPIENGKKYAFNVLVDDGESQFTAQPVMYISDFNNSLMREPDIVNRFTKDIYLEPLGYDDNQGKSSGKNFNLEKGQSVNFKDVKITFKGFKRSENAIENMQAGKDFYIGADIVVEKDGKTFNALPKFQNKGGNRSYTSDIIEEADIKLKLSSLNAAGSIGLEVSSLSNPQMNAPKEVLSVQASIKPFINLVWLGTLVMVLGFFIAVVRRVKENK